MIIIINNNDNVDHVMIKIKKRRFIVTDLAFMSIESTRHKEELFDTLYFWWQLYDVLQYVSLHTPYV